MDKSEVVLSALISSFVNKLRVGLGTISLSKSLGFGLLYGGKWSQLPFQHGFNLTQILTIQCLQWIGLFYKTTWTEIYFVEPNMF